MTWQEIVSVEPHLHRMFDEAKKVDGSEKYFCANDIWYERFKPQLKYLVGWYAKDPRLASMDCYDLAYQKIYKVLPPCKECVCL